MFANMPTNIVFDSISGDEYKKIKNFEIKYGVKDTQFGKCLLGVHDKSICYMSLFDEGKQNTAMDDLQTDWPNAILEEDAQQADKLIDAIFEAYQDKMPTADEGFNVLLKGTELQVKVWKELTKLKEGMTANYEQIAKAVGNPKAVRAVANAIAKNKIAYLIPCHRVIRKKGAPNKYRWGPNRKMDMLKYESGKGK